MLKFKFLGTTDDVTTCECCGRKDLAKTIAIQEMTADGEAIGMPLFFGEVCAAKALKIGVKVVRQETSAADKAKAEAIRAEQNRIANARIRHEQTVLFPAFRTAAGLPSWTSDCHLTYEQHMQWIAFMNAGLAAA